MNQTKLESLIEALINVLIGYGVAIASQIIIFAHYNMSVPLSQNLLIGFWFTLISIARSYAIRRFFNAGLHKIAVALSKRLLA